MCRKCFLNAVQKCLQAFIAFMGVIWSYDQYVVHQQAPLGVDAKIPYLDNEKLWAEKTTDPSSVPINVKPLITINTLQSYDSEKHLTSLGWG